jgi:hypothetical protein
LSNRGVVEAFAQANAEDDLDAIDALIHDDYALDFPQSGERILGRVNRRAMLETYPGRAEAGMSPSFDRIIGTDDKFIPGPAPFWNMTHIAGSGDDFQATGTITYPDDSVWHFVSLLTLRGGKIWREVIYFAEPFDAPAWRSRLVERTE